MSSDTPINNAKAAAPPPARNDQCPECSLGKLRRSHRRGGSEIVRSWFGYYPYRCSNCPYRIFWKDDRPVDRPTAKPDKRPESRRRRHQRILREFLFYALAIAAFFALLHYILREPAQ